MSYRRNRICVWRVSSQATMCASCRMRSARGETSSRLPIGVATRYSFPISASRSHAVRGGPVRLRDHDAAEHERATEDLWELERLPEDGPRDDRGDEWLGRRHDRNARCRQETERDEAEPERKDRGQDDEARDAQPDL